MNTFEALEFFTFADGTVALAWVTWMFTANGERTCVGVRRMPEVSR